MNNESRSIEGHYDYYGIPAYILKQKNGVFASGFYDPSEKAFKAGGSVKRILWDGVKVTLTDAKKLIQDYSRRVPGGHEESGTPEWVLLPEEASTFLEQSDRIHSEGGELLKRLAYGIDGRSARKDGPRSGRPDGA